MNHIPKNTNLLKQLMENITDHIFFKDIDSRFILLNMADANWLGFKDPDEVIGKDDFDLFTEDFAQVARNDEIDLMESGSSMKSKEERQTWPDGSVTWVSTTKAPLKDDDGRIVGCIGIGRDITDIKEKEFELEKANLKLRKINDQISEDLHMAAQLQQTFLPQSYPEFIARNGQQALDFSHYYEADIQIGGDFCAIFKLDEHSSGMLICDVMGHGVRAALVTSIIRTLAENLAREAASPGDFLSAMNHRLHPLLQSGEAFLFATACYITIDCSDGTLKGALAGHDAPLLIRHKSGTTAPVEEAAPLAGPALAIAPEHTYSTFETSLRPGDKVILYTDGIAEATDEEHEEFGVDRLTRITNTNRNLPVQELLPKIVQEVRSYSKNQYIGDDICLLGFCLNTTVAK